MEQPDCEKCLGEIFSAQKIKDTGNMEDIILLKKELSYVINFITDLRDHPPFWRRAYKKKISELCETMGL